MSDMPDNKALSYCILTVNTINTLPESQTVWICALQSCVANGAGCAWPAVEATGGGRQLLKGAEISQRNGEISRNKICSPAPRVSVRRLAWPRAIRNYMHRIWRACAQWGTCWETARRIFVEDNALAELIKGFVYELRDSSMICPQWWAPIEFHSYT